MQAINPYLHFPGTALQAFEHYRSIFGGRFALVMRYKEAPAEARMPGADPEGIMHIALPLPGGSVLMGSDACSMPGFTLNTGNHAWLSLGTDSRAETDRLFQALSAGGSAQMQPQQTFWGAYFAMCTDRFGIQWMLNHHPQPAG